MREINMRYSLTALMVIALSGWYGTFVPDAAAQKIVCWKDKSGKVIGCGDKVPPEYADSGIKELDKRGVTLKTTDSADEIARRKTQDQASSKKAEEERRRIAEQQRQDTALMNTFTNEKEIDLKRDRELQAMDTQLAQARASHKIAVDRLNEAKAGGSVAGKDKKQPSGDALKDEIARAESDKTKAEQTIATKEKEIAVVRKRYAEMKERYIQLKGGGTPAPAPGATAAAPAPAAPAKK